MKYTKNNEFARAKVNDIELAITQQYISEIRIDKRIVPVINALRLYNLFKQIIRWLDYSSSSNPVYSCTWDELLANRDPNWNILSNDMSITEFIISTSESMIIFVQGAYVEFTNDGELIGLYANTMFFEDVPGKKEAIFSFFTFINKQEHETVPSD